MTDINLLPSEYGPDPVVARISNKIVRVAIVEFSILVIFAIVGIGSFFIVSNRVDESSSSQQDLKTSISSLESTEQRLFLLKDRISKAGSVLAAESAVDEVDEFQNVQQGLPTGVEFVKAEFFTNKMEIVYAFNDSQLLVDTLLLIETSGQFSKIELLSLDFTPETGYQVALSLVRKP